MNKAATASIILAGGQGKRLNSKEANKVVYPFLGKPMIKYGVDLFKQVSTPVVIVVGAFAESVKAVLKNETDILYAFQKEQLGTGHAVKVALEQLGTHQPELVLVGMGDHMMYYSKKTIEDLLELHKKESAVATFVSTKLNDPEEAAWGHVERGATGAVVDIIEHKDGNEKQKKIKEVNAGLYCFDFKFLKTHINSIHKSPVTGEYYLTDIIKVAFTDKLPVAALIVPFQEVGIGVNRADELEKSQVYYKKTH